MEFLEGRMVLNPWDLYLMDHLLPWWDHLPLGTPTNLSFLDPLSGLPTFYFTTHHK